MIFRLWVGNGKYAGCFFGKGGGRRIVIMVLLFLSVAVGGSVGCKGFFVREVLGECFRIRFWGSFFVKGRLRYLCRADGRFV